jgi:hypothetical protein
MNLFKETQKMTQWWIWTILLGTTGIVLYEIINETLSRQLSLTEFVKNPQLWSSVVILMLVLVLFYLLSLKTEVNSSGISIHYFPMWRTHIPWDQIKSAELIKYGFVGYGIRFSIRYGTVYNAKGNKGLQIVKKNGSKILIGTQRPEELKAAVTNFL